MLSKLSQFSNHRQVCSRPPDCHCVYALSVNPQLTPGCEAKLTDVAAPGFPVLPLAVDQQVLFQGGLSIKVKPAHLTLELYFAVGREMLLGEGAHCNLLHCTMAKL